MNHECFRARLSTRARHLQWRAELPVRTQGALEKWLHASLKWGSEEQEPSSHRRICGILPIFTDLPVEFVRSFTENYWLPLWSGTVPEFLVHMLEWDASVSTFSFFVQCRLLRASCSFCLACVTQYHFISSMFVYFLLQHIYNTFFFLQCAWLPFLGYWLRVCFREQVSAGKMHHSKCPLVMMAF